MIRAIYDWALSPIVNFINSSFISFKKCLHQDACSEYIPSFYNKKGY